VCIFSKIRLFTFVFFSFTLPCVKIINKILKICCCLTLLCVSRVGWLRTLGCFFSSCLTMHGGRTHKLDGQLLVHDKDIVCYPEV
jgi:hypothetical protein